MWIRDRFEITIGDLTLRMKLPVKAKTFINSPGWFFHYEPLFTSSFSKNLITPEATMLSKRLKYYSLYFLILFKFVSMLFTLNWGKTLSSFTIQDP